MDSFLPTMLRKGKGRVSSLHIVGKNNVGELMASSFLTPVTQSNHCITIINSLTDRCS